jgi:peptide/nickel transport system substrate-binding protein
MSQKLNVTRRDFLRLAGMTTAGAALAACQTKVVKETQIVTVKETVAPQIVKETVAPEVVQQTVVVKQTEIVKEEVVKEVTATPPPIAKEAPMLAEMVAAGTLPPLAERLPANPLVIPEISEVGEYGGLLRQYAPNTTTFHDLHWVRESNWCRKAGDCYFDKGEKGVVMHRAESITYNDEMTEFMVTLRKGMKWSDGTPVTADDVMFAVEDVWFNPDFDGIAWWRGDWWFGEYPTVTKVDDFSVKFVFTKPATNFLNDHTGWGSNQGLGMGEVPSHYLKQFHIKYNPDAEKNAKAAGYDNWQKMYDKMAACGTGQINVDLPTINCWMLKTHTDTQNVYVRNPYFWAVDSAGNQLPYIDGFIVEAVGDVEVAKLKLVAGDFDLAGVFLITLNEYPMLKKNEQNGKYLVVLNKGNCTAKPMIAPNLNHKDPVMRELFQNAEFRKALSYGINRSEISEIAFAGLGVGMQNVYTVWDHVDPAKWQKAYAEYDPDKAKQILDGILKKDANGNYLRPDGSPLTFNLQTITEEGWANTVEIVAKQWTDLGIPSQYSPTARDLWSERNNANELDFFIWHDYSYSESVANNTGGAFAGWALNEKAWNWYYWLAEKGKHPEEEEPPAEWKQYYADVKALSESVYGSDEYKALAEKVWNFRVTEQLYVIGTIGDFPTPLFIKYEIGNFGNNAVPFNYWQGQYPEQWYWKDPVRQAEKVP